MEVIQTIQAFGTQFRYSKARDFEVIIDSNDYINYSKLLEQISGQTEKLRLLCKNNSSILTLIYDYEKEKIDEWMKKTMKSSVRLFSRTEENDEILSLPQTMTISQLVEANVFIVYTGGTHRELWGTYGPRYLLDILIMFTDVRYYRCIHETLEAIDAYAIENNKSFANELKQLQEQYKEQRKYLAKVIREKDIALKHSKHRCRDVLAELKSFRAESAIRERELIAKLDEAHEDIDTLHNMVFGVKNTAEDTKRIVSRQDSKLDKLTKAAGFVVHEMKKQTIAKTRVDVNTDIMVLYRTQMKPAADDIRAQATETQMWLGSYNGDIENYKPNKLPADYDEIYYIESNRLNSFKYILQHEDVAPFIVKTYQRSILIEEDDLEAFIDAVDGALNENKEFKSIISLEKAKEEIEAKKAEAKERNKERDLKSKILKDYSPVHIVINRFKRLVYCYIVDEDGNEVLTPLVDVNRELAIKAKWFYRYGAGGKRIQEISFSAISSSTFSKNGDARIRYEE